MRKLNILNGEALKNYFDKYYNSDDEEIISFNECMTEGDLHKHVFSEEFFKVREINIARLFNVTPEDYRQKTVEELSALLTKKYDEIVLWFDFDMFCQINLLTILAYLDSSNFKGKVIVNIIKQDFFECSSFNDIIEGEIELENMDIFYNLYVDILVDRKFEAVNKRQYEAVFEQLPWLKEGVKLYIKYHGSNNEIKDFIKARIHKSRYEILVDLIKELNNYGLGDTQYMKILDEMGIK